MAFSEFIGPRLPAPAVGIDLGLKDCATASNEKKLHGRWYREHELELAKAQWAKKKKRVKAIHAKIKNQRKDDMHQFSTRARRGQARIIFCVDAGANSAMHADGCAAGDFRR